MRDQERAKCYRWEEILCEQTLELGFMPPRILTAAKQANRRVPSLEPAQDLVERIQTDLGIKACTHIWWTQGMRWKRYGKTDWWWCPSGSTWRSDRRITLGKPSSLVLVHEVAHGVHRNLTQDHWRGPWSADASEDRAPHGRRFRLVLADLLHTYCAVPVAAFMRADRELGWEPHAVGMLAQRRAQRQAANGHRPLKLTGEWRPKAEPMKRVRW